MHLIYCLQLFIIINLYMYISRDLKVWKRQNNSARKFLENHISDKTFMIYLGYIGGDVLNDLHIIRCNKLTLASIRFIMLSENCRRLSESSSFNFGTSFTLQGWKMSKSTFRTNINHLFVHRLVFFSHKSIYKCVQISNIVLIFHEQPFTLHVKPDFVSHFMKA